MTKRERDDSDYADESCKAAFVDEIHVDSLEYKSPSVRPNGSKHVFVSTVAGSTLPEDRLCFQMSRSSDRKHLQQCVWDLSKPMEDAANATRRSLEVSVDDPDLAAFLKALDERNVKEATANSEAWFKKKLDETTIANNYQSIFRERAREEYSDSIRIKVNTAVGDRQCTDVQVVVRTTPSGELVCRKGTPDDLQKGARVMVMVNSSGIWISRFNFGMSIQATCILVWPVRRVEGVRSFHLGAGVSLVDESEANGRLGE